jgi:hypothetical protein
MAGRLRSRRRSSSFTQSLEAESASSAKAREQFLSIEQLPRSLSSPPELLLRLDCYGQIQRSRNSAHPLARSIHIQYAH